MITFKHIIKDPSGMHARPAGQLMQTAVKLSSNVYLEHGGQKVDCVGMIALMRTGIRCGDEITIVVEGENEAADFEVVREFVVRTL